MPDRPSMKPRNWRRSTVLTMAGWPSIQYLLLKSMNPLSDVDLVERSKLDLSYIFFLDMAPEEAVIDPSSLTKFRKLRLKDSHLLDLLIEKTMAIAIDLDLIETGTIIVDATHTQSR